MAIVIEATHTDYERIKHLSGLVDSAISGGDELERDTPSELSVLLEDTAEEKKSSLWSKLLKGRGNEKDK